MKKINLLLVGVLLSTLMFAKGTVAKPNSSSTVSVVNPNGSSLFKVFYQSKKRNNVVISIINAKGKLVHSETIWKVEGFIRPYNFEGLPDGSYVIELKDEGGVVKEIINYAQKQNLFSIRKLADEGKLILTAATKGADEIRITFLDENDKVIYTESNKVTGQFAKIFDVRSLKSFKVEISDNKGDVKAQVF